MERGDGRALSSHAATTVGGCRPARRKFRTRAGRNHVHVAGVQEIGGAPVRIQILLLNLEANHVRILITPVDIIDRHREAPASGMPRCHSPTADRK